DHLDLLTEEVERNLLRDIYNFNNTTVTACKNYKPSFISNYLFDLSKSFNRFYREAPILKLEDEKLRAARLALIESFAATSFKALELLGIKPPEKM
ncbi:DALR anticodon-binding domain-containing protein, partial [bacterium]|nr:DALR anticodon-binding domain-containing protein [bacterium]